MKPLMVALALIAGLAGAVESVKVLRGRGLFTGAPGMNVPPTQAPGESAPLPRPYPGAPPLIPHGISELSITRTSNDCLACHLEGMEVAEGHRAVKIPPSHREDGVVAARYQCRQCHVPQDAIARPPIPQAP